MDIYQLFVILFHTQIYHQPRKQKPPLLRG